MSGLDVSLEPTYNASVVDELRERGHNITVVEQPEVSYGRGQAIYRLDDGYFAGSDGRADGQAVGF